MKKITIATLEYRDHVPYGWIATEFCHLNIMGINDAVVDMMEQKWHNTEFEKYNNWYIIEKFAEYAGNHEHIWYATNIEIYDYVKAYESLQTSFDKKIIHNPTSIDVWFDVKGDVYCVRGGETIYL